MGHGYSRLCTNCRTPMRKLGLAAHYQRTVEIDVCEPCSLIWFDGTESARLAGPGVVDLVRVIHGAMQLPKPMQPLPATLSCPICTASLKLVANRSRYGRTMQLECENKHGAFQSFTMFLAEKGYFRPFSWADIKTLMESGKRPSCFNCGAMLDPRPHDECPYCRSPVGMIDPARLARAIDADMAAPALQLAVTVEQAACPCCGGAIDLSADVVCRHCMAVVRPVETQQALMASENVAPQVRRNYARQTAAVSRRKLDAMGESDAIGYAVPRTEGIRRGVIMLLAMVTIGFVIVKGASFKPAVVIDGDTNEKMSAAEFNKRQEAKRQAEMAKIPHAPAGIVPPGLKVTQDGRRLVLESQTDRRMSIKVNLAYDQYEGFWKHCDMLNTNKNADRVQVYLLKPGDVAVLEPGRCGEQFFEKGRYEYSIWDLDKGAYVFKSDSAFYW